MPDDPLNVPTDPKLPEVPGSWKELVKEIREVLVLIAAIVAAVGSQLNCQQSKETNNAVQVTAQKVDATAAKVDAVEDKTERTKMIATKTAEKVGAKVNGN